MKIVFRAHMPRQCPKRAGLTSQAPVPSCHGTKDSRRSKAVQSTDPLYTSWDHRRQQVSKAVQSTDPLHTSSDHQRQQVSNAVQNTNYFVCAMGLKTAPDPRQPKALISRT
eukprot:33690-Pelagomonas_calceolata.AAC.2